MFSCNEDSLDLHTDIEETSSIAVKTRSCGVHDHMSELMQNAQYKNAYDQRMQAFDKLNSERPEKAACNNPVVIPVAVHYQNASTAQRSCLIALAQNQINILNADYAGSNGDINKWNNQASSSFPGVSNGEACLKFVLANKNHPNGFNLQNGDVAVTINQTNGDQSNQWSGYLNIFVQSNTGLLGYAPFGGSGNGDGVVIDASAFGTGNGCGVVSPDAPYNLGRTLTHEVGHYFLLDHIWGNGCNQDDGVADTPGQASDYGGCPNVGASSCGTTDMHMNYMDYTNDACMYMFSNGQAVRMENYVSANLSNLSSNAANVIDGEGNGNEEEEEEEEEEESCDAPASATAKVLSTTRVRLNWADEPGATRYRIRYREVGTSKWFIKNSVNSQRTLTKLVAGVKYQYQIRTQCAQGWTSYNQKRTFTITDSDDEGDDSINKSYTLKLTLDDWGSETTWYILDENNKEIFNGGPYQDGQAGQVISKDIQLVRGCYELELQDAYGDGICCDYGNGSAKILDSTGKQVVALNGNFGTYDYVGFCVDGNGLRVEDLERDIKLKNLKKKK